MEILCNLSRPIACCLLWVQPSLATNHLLPPWLLGFVWRSQTVAGKDNGSFTSQQVSFPIPSPFPAICFCMALVSLSFAFPWCQKALRVSATVACSFSSASPFTQDWSIWSIDNIDISIRETALVMASAIWCTWLLASLPESLLASLRSWKHPFTWHWALWMLVVSCCIYCEACRQGVFEPSSYSCQPNPCTMAASPGPGPVNVPSDTKTMCKQEIVLGYMQLRELDRHG